MNTVHLDFELCQSCKSTHNAYSTCNSIRPNDPYNTYIKYASNNTYKNNYIKLCNGCANNLFVIDQLKEKLKKIQSIVSYSPYPTY